MKRKHKGKGKGRPVAVARVKRQRRLCRVDEYQSRSASGWAGELVGRGLADPPPGGRAEHVARWVPRLVAVA